MEAYHHANYELSALLCVLSEQVNDEEVVDAVGEIIEQYEEIAERAGVDFSPYEGYEVNDAMSYEKAQTLAVAVVGQGFVSEIEDKVKAVALDFEDSENIEE